MLDRLFGHHQPLSDRTPQTLQVGDAVSYDGENFLVEQRITYHGDGGDLWWNFVLVGSQRQLLFDVDEDDGLDLTMYEEAQFHPSLPLRGPVSYQGATYEQEEHGFADASVNRRNSATAERVEYWYLEAADDHQMMIRRLGDNEEQLDPALATGTVIVHVGVTIKQHQISLFPGTV